MWEPLAYHKSWLIACQKIRLMRSLIRLPCLLMIQHHTQRRPEEQTGMMQTCRTSAKQVTNSSNRTLLRGGHNGLERKTMNWPSARLLMHCVRFWTVYGINTYETALMLSKSSQPRGQKFLPLDPLPLYF